MPRTIKINKIKESLPSFLKIKEESYIGKNSKATFIDELYGEYEATPRSVLKGQGLHHNRAILTIKNIKKTPEEVQEQLPKHLILKKETYVNNSTKCTFIDNEFGEYISTPNLVISKNVQHPKRTKLNKEKTCMEKYGYSHPSKSPEIHSKMKKAMRKSKILYHWKTNEEILTIGSFESRVVLWLNNNEIDFRWQIPFILTNGSTYYCDLFLIDQNLYVEIKGWWQQEVSKQKWEEFHETNSNSELWTREVLIEKKIIIGKR